MITEDELKQFEEVRQALQVYLKGDQNAIEFCINLLKTSHFLDDIADGGQVTPSEITDGFIRIVLEIPFNPFFQTFRTSLVPMMINTMLCWQDSNTLDRGSKHDRHISYGLRSAGIQMIAFCAFLLGGNEWAKKVGPEIRRLLIEDMDRYLEEMETTHGISP